MYSLKGDTTDMLKVKAENQSADDFLDGKEVSEQEYLDQYMEYPDANFEYVDGRLRRLRVSVNDVISMGEFLLKLFSLYFDNNSNYNKTLFLQQNYSTKMGKLKNNYRKPDYMVVDRGYDPYDNKIYRAYIIIELVSRGAENLDKKDKKKEYELKGVEYYLIVDETVEKSKFYQLNNQHEYEEITVKDNDIIELAKYKGLKFRLSDVFGNRNAKSLSADSLYQDSFGYLRRIGKSEGIKIGKSEGIKIGKSEGIKIGKSEGIKIGKTEGIKIGEEKGRVEGIKIGEEKRKIEIAKKLKSMGLSVEQIIRATGLNREDIENC